MQTHRALAVALVLAAALPAFADGEYAAESFTGGYVEPPAPPATGQDPAVKIGTGQDDATAEIALPFEFPFYGRLYTKVTACSNGWLAFGSTTSSESNNAALPSPSAPNAIVAALWDDLTTGTGRVKAFTTGTAPSRTFIVAWHKVDTFSSATTDELSFEVKLFEGTGVVEIAYATTGTWNGLSYTAGIEDATGLLAVGAGSTANTNSGQPALDWRFTPRAMRITGTLLRDRPVAGADGLGVTTETGLPVQGIDVELVRGDDGAAAGRGRSADDGTYTATVLGADPATALSLDLLASGGEGRVIDASGNVHRLRIATGFDASSDASAGTFTLDGSADATNASIRRAVNIQQAAHRGLAFAQAAAAAAVAGTDPAVPAESIPALDFRFVAGTAATGGRTAYTDAVPPAAAIVNVHDASDNPDGWDDDVVLRECGFHVLRTISSDAPLISSRAWATATAAPAAWADGFSHWFACAVQGRATFIDTKSATTATVFDLEAATPAPAALPTVTGAVATALWDLVDPANETYDSFEGTTGGAGSTSFAILRVVDRAMDATRTGGYTALEFLDAWTADAALTDDSRRAAARAFIHQGAVADDAREANDLAGEESALGTTQRVDGLTLTRWNEDRFGINWTPALFGVLEMTVTQTTTATLDLEVVNALGFRVAFATNDGVASKSRVTLSTVAPLDPGAYVIRVISHGDAKASYSLAVYEPMALVQAFAPWTQGQAYKGDLIVLGGVPPYTYVTTAQIPGLAIAAGGSRLTGTPTAAGDYPVHVVVGDASGAGTSLVRDMNLQIARPLGIARYLGVAAGVFAGVDAGRGGTGALWETDDPSPSGMSLAVGPTLRLLGAAGTPRSFEISGRATDATGAAYDGAGTVVVCPLLPATGVSDVPVSTAFGWWFDAVQGGRVDLTFRFSGRGERPTLAAIVDAEGNELPLTGAVTYGPGRRVRVRGVRTERSGRHYAIFTSATAPAELRMAVGGAIAPPPDVHGVVVIDPKDAVVDVPFEAAAGSRLRIELRPELVPDAVAPSLFALYDSAGTRLDNPAPRRLRGGGFVWVLTAPEGRSGTYRLSIAGDRERTGPVFWRVRASGPRTRSFELFSSD